TYTFGSQSITTGGTYTRTLVAANGCDSIISLTLQVIIISNTNLNAEICQGSSYIFGNQNITTSGTYTLNLTNTIGCDSVVTLDLLVNPTYAQSIQANIPFGNSYAFNGQNLTTSGTYTANLLSVKGCDSVLTLNLIVDRAPIITSIGNTNGCIGDTISIPVQVQYGNGIGAISLALNYNASALSFIGFENANPAIQSSNLLINAGVFAGQSQVRLSWFNANPINLGNSPVPLVNYRFVVNASSTLAWDLATAGNCEYADATATPITAVQFNNGAVTANPVPVTTLTQTIPYGTTFAFCGQTLQYSGNYSCTLTSPWSPPSVKSTVASVIPSPSPFLCRIPWASPPYPSRSTTTPPILPL
ncbi:MAG: hypothetical protein EBV00_05700, partial [Burkholderiaceae bacterium]|nr:hypothetical protein [Burkholderiaceae bacterium]